jgi:hypothetical protein
MSANVDRKSQCTSAAGPRVTLGGQTMSHPRGALGCDRRHRDLSPCPGLARCLRTHCPEAVDTTIQSV